MSEPKLSLINRKNIKENDEKVNEDKERIQKAVDLSTEVTLDADYANFAQFVEKAGYKDRVGEVVRWYTEAIANCMENTFKEETAKAALQSNWTTGVIRIRTATNKKGEYKYESLDIENGDLVLTVYQLANVGSAMSGLLDKLGDSSTGLSVKASQNVKENEEKKNEILQAIHDDTQLSADVTIDIDWPAFAAKFDKEGYNDRVGECVTWFLEPLKDVFSRYFKNDEIARAAIQSAWTTGVIKFELATNKKGENKYNETQVRDGDLVVSVYSLSNASNCGSDIIDRMHDPASNLPLRSALNLKEQDEKKEENLKRLQNAVGLSNDVTVDIDWVAFDALVTKLGYKDRIGEVIYDWILGALAGNVENICKEELTKEAIAESCTTGVIRFEENKKISYHAVEFNNGDLIIQYKPENFVSNTGSVGSDIESKL